MERTSATSVCQRITTPTSSSGALQLQTQAAIPAPRRRRPIQRSSRSTFARHQPTQRKTQCSLRPPPSPRIIYLQHQAQAAPTPSSGSLQLQTQAVTATPSSSSNFVRGSSRCKSNLRQAQSPCLVNFHLQGQKHFNSKAKQGPTPNDKQSKSKANGKLHGQASPTPAGKRIPR